MGISGSGVTPATIAAVSPVGAASQQRGGAEGSEPDFGPAVEFTASAFDQAVNIQMYNSAGNAIALTQWLRSGTLPAPQPVAPTDG